MVIEKGEELSKLKLNIIEKDKKLIQQIERWLYNELNCEDTNLIPNYFFFPVMVNVDSPEMLINPCCYLCGHISAGDRDDMLLCCTKCGEYVHSYCSFIKDVSKIDIQTFKCYRCMPCGKCKQQFYEPMLAEGGFLIEKGKVKRLI